MESQKTPVKRRGSQMEERHQKFKERKLAFFSPFSGKKKKESRSRQFVHLPSLFCGWCSTTADIVCFFFFCTVLCFRELFWSSISSRRKGEKCSPLNSMAIAAFHRLLFKKKKTVAALWYSITKELQSSHHRQERSRTLFHCFKIAQWIFLKEKHQ